MVQNLQITKVISKLSQLFLKRDDRNANETQVCILVIYKFV